jgi:carbonic anhydrase
MLKRSLVLVASIAFASALADHGAPHWSYEGAEGPEHWGDLDPSFKDCKLGHLQSPIDIPAASLHPTHLDPLHFDYKAVPLHIVDNGHTVMATVPPGSVLRVGTAEYEVQQIHFHEPSEEAIDGKHFPLVAHIVHKDEQGHLAVVAVLFKEGAASRGLTAAFGHMPAPTGKEEAPRGAKINAKWLLPSQTSYFTFQGSLTTPPCTEGVTWYVLRTPATASAEQIAAFGKRYPHDARPVQPIDGREIRASE